MSSSIARPAERPDPVITVLVSNLAHFSRCHCDRNDLLLARIGRLTIQAISNALLLVQGCILAISATYVPSLSTDLLYSAVIENSAIASYNLRFGRFGSRGK